MITLTLQSTSGPRLDLEGITPDRLAALGEREIAALPVWAGGERLALGDLFDVRGGRSVHVRLEGDLSRAVRVGAYMTAGVLDVAGSVGDDAGLSMAGGTLRIRGHAGDRLGAAAPGASKGMTGGEIIVDGSAGVEAGARLRRGLIVIGGNVGARAARDIIAGTVVVLGATGSGAGRGSKRGSVIAVGPIDIPPTYRYACTFESPYVRLLMTYLCRTYDLLIPAEVVDGRYQRYCGDAGPPGKGEILRWVSSAGGVERPSTLSPGAGDGSAVRGD
jgi:formylmethanofuran dehydrogenase subunit C